jgi:TonB-linked SusC/RagA family outer membrane protein
MVIFTILKMRYLFFLLFFFIIIDTFGQQKKITLMLQNVTVKSALESLQKESDMSLWFNTRDVDLKKIISVNIRNGAIEDALQIILSGQNVCFELKYNNIIISKVSVPKEYHGGNVVLHRISGLVIDEGGVGLPNVVVRTRKNQIGTVTNAQGVFTIDIPVDTKLLIFSFVGMVTAEVSVQNNMKVTLESDNKVIKEFVVTALNIKRDKKSLSYSSQTIREPDVSSGRDVNITSILSGNIAGMDVLQSSAGAGGSTKITLRGPKNITSTNQPLFVIDGVPMANYQTSDPYGFYAGRDSGDGMSNINPDDIESLTILKGANAAALYGSQGANGVILITTKKGSPGKTKITFNTGITATKVAELPTLQFTYGQTDAEAEDSWGKRGSYPNNVKDFFNTGITLQNSLMLSTGGERSSSYFSYGNTYSTGVMPTNKYVKNNISFRQSSDFFNRKVNVTSSVMFTEEQLHNTILTGYYWNPLLGLYNFPRGLNFNYYKKNYQYLDANRNIMVQNWPVSGNAEGQMNPYWILYNDPDDTHTKRMIADVGVKFNPVKGVEFSARGTYDFTNQLYTMRAMANSSSVLVSENGRYVYSNLDSWQAYGDCMVTVDRSISRDIDLHAVLGSCYQKKVIGDGLYIDSNVYGLTLANVFTLQNIASLYAFSTAQTIASRIIKESVYGNLSLGFKNRIYIDLSGRNDWASSLAFTDHLSYFYPSVGVSVLLGQMISLPRWINFLKLRTSFAEVSNEIPSFITNQTGTVSVGGYTASFTKAFSDLKPEMVDNYEAGVEAKLFDSKLGLDVTFYQIENRNQYLELTAPSGSGYSSYYINAGHIRTRGIEVTLNLTPVKTKRFLWNSVFNYSSNHNKILKLSNELSGYYTIPGGGEGYEMKVIAGGSMGDIYTYAFKRDANGNLILGPDHVPIKSATEQKVGNANPDCMLGWNNKFNYGKFNFSFLLDGKFGGKFVSMTQSYLDRNGVTQATADARDAGGVYVSGVLQDGTPWSGMVDAKTYYTGISGRDGIMEKYVYDATNIRLRKLILGYTFSLPSTKNSKMSLNLSLVGSNLFFLYKKAPGDPNTTISMGNGTQSVENFGLPSTRSFTFNVKLDL